MTIFLISVLIEFAVSSLTAQDVWDPGYRGNMVFFDHDDLVQIARQQNVPHTICRREAALSKENNVTGEFE